MKVSELTKILESLETHTPKGKGIYTLSKETNIEAQTLREYFSKYTDYFVQLPNDLSYQINRFGKFKGSVKKMIQHHENELEADKHDNWLIYALFISVFVTLLATLG